MAFRTLSISDQSVTASRLLEETTNPGGGLMKNKVITSQYTRLNFLIKNGFKQFQRITNRYFLMISCMPPQ